MDTCPLCQPQEEGLVHVERRLRVILVDESDYPGYCRVIWNTHVAEMTDLSASDRQRLLEVVLAVESALRETLAPCKVNLASLGNVVPHLHWHVIPRFADDAHFPEPIWGARQRPSDPLRLAERRSRLAALRASIASRLSAGG